MNLEDIHPIRGPIYVPSFFEEWMPVFIILAVLAVVGSALWQYLKRKRRRQNVPAPLPPYEEAIARLEAAKLLMTPGKDKELSIALSDALRIYLENEHGAHSTVKTSEEFLLEVRNELTFRGKALESLTHFLENADLAKFAKVTFAPKDQENLYRLAKTFIEMAHEEKKAAEQAAMLDMERSAQ